MNRTWAEISLTALRQNFRNLQRHVGDGVVLCAVLKGNATGHGVAQCARALESEGAPWFAVGWTDEGVCLRDAGIRGRILLLAGYSQGEEEEVIGRRLTPALWEPWQARCLAKAVDTAGLARFPVHLKVDTGLARLGAAVAVIPEILRALRSLPQLHLEGVFTHLASAEVLDAPDVLAQTESFETVRQTILQDGFSPNFFHMANSAAIALRPATWKDMVRPGLSLFGYYPRFVLGGAPCPVPVPPVSPVLSWKTRIVSLREIPANQPVGYNGTYVTTKPTRLAVIPVGFADGLKRQQSRGGRAILGDDYAPIAGTVAMELTLLDVSHVDGVCLGDEVILIGCAPHCRITAWDHADIESTVPDEVLCGIAARVPRIYLETNG